MNNTSQKNKPLLLGILLFSLLLAPFRGETASFRLVYNNDNRGELEGCG